jgi:tetratricopeptide (TPR) repeat protein
MRPAPDWLSKKTAVATAILTIEGNLTIGNVSALRGLRDDPKYIRITTPVQPGNSGGPLLDSSGNVIGVVAAKLDAIRVMRAIGDVPQNVNFAVELATLRRFLSTHGVRATLAPSTDDLRPADIGERAKRFTYLIECVTAATPLPALVEAPEAPAFNDLPRPPPVSFKPIQLDARKLKFSNIRKPYPTLSPEVFEIVVSNVGQDRVTELTIGFVRGEKSCSGNFSDYDGLKRFTVNLLPADSVTLTAAFGTQAKRFCIVRAVGPPEGLAGCSNLVANADAANSIVNADVVIAACTRTIESGQVSESALGRVYFHRGDAYGAKGDLDRAIADYTESIRLNPKSGSAFFFRGREYARKEDYNRAIDDYSEAIRLSSKIGASALGSAYALRGYAYLRNGDNVHAITDYNEAIRLDPKNASSYYNRGSAHYAKGDNDQAIADYTEAIRLNLNPGLAAVYHSRGSAFQQKGDNDRAIVDYTEVIRLNPKSSAAYNNRGNVYLAKGDLDRAVADYTEAIRLNSNLAPAYHNRARAYRRKGDNDRAMADDTEASRLDSKKFLPERISTPDQQRSSEKWQEEQGEGKADAARQHVARFDLAERCTSTKDIYITVR